MGAYRELRKPPRGVSIASEFDDRVEAVRAAADEGEFDLYIIAQEEQTLSVMLRPSGSPVR